MDERMDEADEDVRIPAWVLGEAAEPDSLASTLYLDSGDCMPEVLRILQLWHDLAVESLLPVVAAAGEQLSGPRISGMEENAAGRQRRVKARRWVDGLTDDLYQLSANWTAEIVEPYMDFGMSVYVFRFEHRHLRLDLSASVPQGKTDAAARAIAEITRRIADATDLPYGEITLNRHPSTNNTHLDDALRRPCSTSADESRQYLRGYEWVTVIPKELVRRLGGVTAVQESGAFVEVTLCSSGGAVLRATERPSEYAEPAAERVFEAVRAVLPPGQPRPIGATDLGFTVMRDASGSCTR